ncbi:arginine decarboxylase [Bacillus sp. M6-12]|uniref:aminotransferase class I/II-fold pyridoxal phosphate-dependent enzyme n=1 Tax=Bacillus sp. M6-12 TaxID=2054166 RepID=UPI000C770F48|nr:aminotransferase class I/II-fold pyridoxal phosphate-dependent enzyme [Bacillus sp. M6-12]PLS15097.1 arginine decarboxylase [Bacillus sp. M6-12]
MNQDRAPLYEALLRHVEKRPISFHVPGHKNGKVFQKEGHAFFENILQLDATELSGLDDLHSPEGPILESQKLLAGFYGAKESFFLVNGSSSGNIAMILAACNEGETVLVQRNCHKSILHGLMLANVSPVYLEPDYYEEWGFAGGVSHQTVTEAAALYPEAKALILTYPNYYGVSEDISKIIAYAHRKGLIVLVDEAHGAHFALGAPFPISSLTAGADVVVHSAHKTLPAMTMGSYLHINGEQIDSEKIRFFLQMLQSSSPSYPIMASLDLARKFAAAYRENDKLDFMEASTCLRKQLLGIPGIKLFKNDSLSHDPLKITLQAEGITGYKFQRLLEEKGIFSEMADLRNVLFVLPLSLKNFPLTDTIERVTETLMAAGKDEEISSVAYPYKTVAVSKPVFTYKEMKQKQKRRVSLADCKGQFIAEMIIPYPPGIPLFMPGERIDEGKMRYLQDLMKAGSRFHGGEALSDGKLLIFE